MSGKRTGVVVTSSTVSEIVEKAPRPQHVAEDGIRGFFAGVFAVFGDGNANMIDQQRCQFLRRTDVADLAVLDQQQAALTVPKELQSKRGQELAELAGNCGRGPLPFANNTLASLDALSTPSTPSTVVVGVEGVEAKESDLDIDLIMGMFSRTQRGIFLLFYVG